MIIFLLVSAIFSLVVLGITGSGAFALLTGGVFFACGLPFALLFSFVGSAVSYVQDRADCRWENAELKAEELVEDHEFAEDERLDRLVEAAKKIPASIYNDNRQVHLHAGSEQHT
jgi:hypothetical protein